MFSPDELMAMQEETGTFMFAANDSYQPQGGDGIKMIQMDGDDQNMDIEVLESETDNESGSSSSESEGEEEDEQEEEAVTSPLYEEEDLDNMLDELDMEEFKTVKDTNNTIEVIEDSEDEEDHEEENDKDTTDEIDSELPPLSEYLEENDLDKMKAPELRALVRAYKLHANPKKMKKNELRELINNSI